jgi:hypothetical protein
MYTLRPISHESVAAALAKAERYRLLAEPTEAESICRDILQIEPENQQALISLILALTDQIPQDSQAFANALSSVVLLHGAYERAYYAGIAWERRARARYQRGGQGAHHYVYDWIVTALQFFDQAQQIRPHGNDEAVLRWNTCVRFLSAHKELVPRPEEVQEPILSE